MGKTIRIVSLSGKYKLMWCEVDEDGYVESILDEVETRYKLLEDMKAFMACVAGASKAAVCCVNAGNRSELIKTDLPKEG